MRCKTRLLGGRGGLLLAAATAGLLLGRLLTLAGAALGAALLTLAGGLAALAGGTACASLGGHGESWFCNWCLRGCP